jgi:hypothetical protein
MCFFACVIDNQVAAYELLLRRLIRQTNTAKAMQYWW